MVEPLRIEIVEVGRLAHGVGGVDKGVLVDVIPPGKPPVEAEEAQKPSEDGYDEDDGEPSVSYNSLHCYSRSGKLRLEILLGPDNTISMNNPVYSENMVLYYPKKPDRDYTGSGHITAIPAGTDMIR